MCDRKGLKSFYFYYPILNEFGFKPKFNLSKKLALADVEKVFDWMAMNDRIGRNNLGQLLFISTFNFMNNLYISCLYMTRFEPWRASVCMEGYL